MGWTPASQYLARSRYHERPAPFLACFARPAIMLVCQEELHAAQRRTLRALFEFLQLDPGRWGPTEAAPRPPEQRYSSRAGALPPEANRPTGQLTPVLWLGQ